MAEATIGSAASKSTPPGYRHKGVGKGTRIPFDANLVKCGDAGVSYQRQFADSPVTRAFTDIAGELIRTGSK